MAALFDDERICCYLDSIGHRVEKTAGGDEQKICDLTLRVQPFTPELAVSLDPDVRALLFRMDNGEPKPKIKAMEFSLLVATQRLTVCAAPDMPQPSIAFTDVSIAKVRARTEKDVDGYGLTFHCSTGPLSPQQLEYICQWHTEQRYVTFASEQLDLGFDKARQVARA